MLEIDKERYSKLIDGVDIYNISMSFINAKTMIDYEDIKERENLKVKVSYGCTEFSVKNNNLLKVNPFFKLSIANEDIECLTFEGEFKIIYSINDLNEFEDEYIEKFIENNVPINIWPYAREVIASSINRLGYPEFNLKPYKRK